MKPLGDDFTREQALAAMETRKSGCSHYDDEAKEHFIEIMAGGGFTILDAQAELAKVADSHRHWCRTGRGRAVPAADSAEVDWTTTRRYHAMNESTLPMQFLMI